MSLVKERENIFNRYAPLLWMVRKVLRHAKLPFGMMMMQHVAYAVVPFWVALATGGIVRALSGSDAKWGATWIWIALLFISYLVGRSHYLISITDYWYQQRLEAALDEPLLKKFGSMSLKQFEDPDTHDLISRTINPSKAVKDICENLIAFGGSILQALLLTIFIGSTVWWIGPLLVLFVLTTAHFETQLGKHFREIERKMSIAEREKRYAGNLLSDRQAAIEFRVFGLGQEVTSRWNRWFQFIQRKRLLFDLSMTWRIFIVRLPQSILLFGCILIFVWQLRETGGDVGQFTALIVAVLPLFSEINEIGDSFRGLGEHNEYLQELQEAYALPDFRTANGNERFPDPMERGIVFEQVSFTYPGESKEALKNINLHIKPGERIALVGANGSGKSTLIKLLLGLYEPASGRILIDGINMQDINEDSLRQAMSVVFQDFGTYTLTAQENIGFGQLDRMNDLTAVKAAAVAGGANEFIEELPAQYETTFGRLMPGGHEPSGGQWQKVAISRALMREAQMLVFDEPAAALDPIAESRLYEHLTDVLHEKTAVLVTHRLGSVHTCDRIIVLDEGTVVEAGTHSELMVTQGLYSRMYASQAEWYEGARHE